MWGLVTLGRESWIPSSRIIFIIAGSYFDLLLIPLSSLLMTGTERNRNRTDGLS